MKRFENFLKTHPNIKQILHWVIMNPIRTRPRWFVRMFQFFYLNCGRHSVIYSSVRRDLVPFRKFKLGRYSVIESFSVVNNAVGDIYVGEYSRIGVGNTLIGPIRIGNNVHIGQHVLITGLNHNYDKFEINAIGTYDDKREVTVGDYVWIGANSVILPGVSIGRRAVIGAGSVVTKNVPSFCVVVGNPAKIVKQYDPNKKEWIRCDKS